MCDSRGFTLVELLIVVAIIAVLLGILLPVLGGVRRSAWSAACLSNLRQASSAWNGHLNDHRFFPFDRPYDAATSHKWDWGGVNWYGVEDTNATTLVSTRPLNPYYDLRNDHREDASEFACPADDGLWHSETLNVLDLEVGGKRESSRAADPWTVYGSRGTSYMANQWIWIKPGSTAAFGPARGDVHNRFGAPGFTSKNSRESVTNPSLFVLVGDASRFELDRLSDERRINQIYLRGTLYRDTLWKHGNWHHTSNNMAFLDGSARMVSIQPDRGITASYTWWMQPTKHMVEGGSSIFPTITGRGWDPRGADGEVPKASP